MYLTKDMWLVITLFFKSGLDLWISLVREVEPTSKRKTSTMFKLLFLLQLKQLTFIELWYESSILKAWYKEIHFYFIVGKFVPSVISTGVFGNSCVIIIVNYPYLVNYHIFSLIISSSTQSLKSNPCPIGVCHILT